MKVKIELTEEQITKLITAETTALEAIKQASIKEADKVFNNAVKLLKNKYKYQEIDTDEVVSVVPVVDDYKKEMTKLNNAISNQTKKGDLVKVAELKEQRETLKASKKYNI